MDEEAEWAESPIVLARVRRDLEASDSQPFHAVRSRQEQYNRDAVKHFDEHASAYWVGLELDEYYDAGTTWHYARQLQGLTKKEIGTHQVAGRWDYAANPVVGNDTGR